jgi:hypothetical protein
MNLTLKKPDLEHYSNGDHLEFHETTEALFAAAPSAIAPALLLAYKTAVKQENSIYKWIHKSEFTEKKAEVHQAREKVFVGMVALLHALKKHFDTTLRDYAYHAAIVVDSYGKIYRVGYDAATAIIDALVETLRSEDYIEAVEALHLTMWLTELTRLNTLFKSYAAKTAEEKGKKPDISTNEARKETDRTMREIAAYLTALIDLNGDATFQSLVQAFNVNVDHYNLLVRERYGRLHAKTDLSAGDVAFANVQPYTGRPVYVIPSVSLRKQGKEGRMEVVELVFGLDFSVAYKNNVEPGTATMVITGVGKYAGEILTTFNIREEVG